MNRRLMFVWLLSAGVFAARGQATDFGEWSYKLPLVFTNCSTGESLPNFPALVILGPQIPGFQYSQFLSGANADLRFEDAVGNECAYEIEKWNTSGKSYVWVQVPVLSNGTRLVASWGKSGDSAPAYTTNGTTWSEGYKAVWHLTTTNDATTNRFDVEAGPASVGTSNAVAGDGYGFIYQGYGGRCTNLNWSPSRFTVSWWVYPPVISGASPSIGDPTTAGWMMHSSGTADLYFYQGNTVAGPVTNIWDVNQWQFFAYTSDGGTGTLYKNGIPVYTRTGLPAPVSPWNTFQIWRQQANNPSYTAIEDEVELSSVARSSNWVWAAYMTMASNASFMSYGGGVSNSFSGWRYRMNIAFTNCPAGSLTNFPVLVKLGSERQKFEYSQFWSGTNADLRFANAAGNECAYEIEKWNTGGTSYVWVQAPELTNGLSLVAYWGKAGVSAPAYTTNGATWSESYKAVWHLTTTNDSTSNRLDVVAGTASVGSSTAVVADGYGFLYQGYGGQCTNLNWSPRKFTVSWWVYPPLAFGASPSIGDITTTSTWLTHENGPAGMYIYVGGAGFNVPDAYAFGQWNHFTYTCDNGTSTLYKSGAQLFCQTNALTMPLWNTFQIWRQQANNPAYTAYEDEVELSSVARSSNWVWSSYMTMASNTVFGSYGPVERIVPKGMLMLFR